MEITKEQLEKLIQTYPFKYQAADSLGVSVYYVDKALKKYGMTYPRANRLGDKVFYCHPEITKEWMIENWVNTGKSMRQLSQETGISEGVFDACREKFNLKKTYRTPLNVERFFDTQDPNIWYLAGLVVTDGYVPKGFNAIEIGLVGDSEKELLDSIAQYYNAVSRYDYEGNFHVLRISYDGVEDLFEKAFNIPSGPKTYTADVPKSFPNEDCAKAYILGCFDGDGYISRTQYAGSLTTASEKLVRGIQAIIRDYLGFETCVYKEKRDGMYYYPTIAFSGTKAKQIEDWMYSAPVSFKLERKFQKYKQVNDIV